MLDSKHFKSLGLQFARALQVAIKTAAVFPIEHKSSERPIQQSFDFLNSVLQVGGQFTFGFIDKEVMLNKILTEDPSLRPLETEFTKRSIAAIKFEPGLGFASYKKLIYLFAAPPANVESVGGLLPYLNQNPIPGLYIVPAKKQNKNAQGDTIIETDSESYILARQRGELKTSGDFLESIDALLESGCFDPAARAEALASLAAGSTDGSGYGVPIDIPRLAVVKDGETVVPVSTASNQTETPAAGSIGHHAGLGPGNEGGADDGLRGTGIGPGGGHLGPGGQGSGPSHAVTGGGPSGVGAGHGPGAGGSGVGAGVGVGVGAGVGGGAGVGVGVARLPASPNMSGTSAGRAAPNAAPDTFLQLVEQSVQRSLAQEDGNPQKSLMSLARLLSNTGVQRILERFPVERREELSRLKPEQLATEYVEDTALQLAGAKIRSAEGSNSRAVEEEVLQVLSRTLQATLMADRLAAKLARFIKDFAIPPHVQARIREELQWTSYPVNKKFARVMERPRYSNLEFRHFMELAKELLMQRDVERVAALVNHYFEFLDAPDARIDSSDLSRVPEIVQTLSSAYAGFAAKSGERLTCVLQRTDISEFIHFQAANGLAALGQCFVPSEEFQNTVTIGFALEKSYSQDPERHKKCCGTALASLVPAAAVERILDNYLQKRGDSSSLKTTANLIRFAAPASIRNVMEHLVNESDARNRLSLIRLAGQLGSGSIGVAIQYLTDERWYVVRNMCAVLAELRDPTLADHIAPALRHSDARVQQAALKALTRGRDARTAQVLADSLSALSPEVLDEALDQLMYLRSPDTVAALEDFAASGRSNVVRATKAAQALGAIADPAALSALGRIFRIVDLDTAVRRAALTAISSQNSTPATQLLQEFSAGPGPLAEEAKKELARRQPKQG